MYIIECSSPEKGKDVKTVCETGCIGCGLCVKNCKSGAAKMVGNLAEIDHTICDGCGACADKCPTGIIKYI